MIFGMNPANWLFKWQRIKQEKEEKIKELQVFIARFSATYLNPDKLPPVRSFRKDYIEDIQPQQEDILCWLA